MHQEQVKIPPNQTQHTRKQQTKNKTIPYARFKHEQHEEQIQKSEELLPSQNVIVKW